MRFKTMVCTLALTLLDAPSFAQQTLPLIKATSEKVSIREGNGPVTRFWDHLNPQVRPVVYSLAKNRSEKLTFYTDIDSIALQVSADHQYDIKVLLNGKDTCYARLSTLVPPYTRESVAGRTSSDTIPFRLGADNYIHVQGSLNGSAPLDLIFDSGASTFVLTERGLKKVKINLDGRTENEGTGGFSTEKTSSSNLLAVAGLNWKNLPLLFYNYGGGLNADGVLGFNIVENKAMEIDYDRQILVLHDPGTFAKSGYSVIPIHHGLEGTFFPLTLSDGKQQASGWFLFDTGGLLTLISSIDFVNMNKLKLSFKGTANVSGTGSGTTTSRVALMPDVRISGFSLPNVPVQLEPDGKSFYGNQGVAGNLVLKRFNVIIDYPDTTLYLKPNGLISQPYNGKNKKNFIFLAVIIFSGLMAVLLFVYRKNFNLNGRISRHLGNPLL